MSRYCRMLKPDWRKPAASWNLTELWYFLWSNRPTKPHRILFRFIKQYWYKVRITNAWLWKYGKVCISNFHKHLPQVLQFCVRVANFGRRNVSTIYEFMRWNAIQNTILPILISIIISSLWDLDPNMVVSQQHYQILPWNYYLYGKGHISNF